MLKVYVQLIRLKHWVKNVLIFSPLFFSLEINSTNVFNEALAFVCFSLAASGIYILNDLIDVQADRLHPLKKKRPIAAGTVRTVTALVLSIILLAFSILVAHRTLSDQVVLIICIYIFINILYSFWLKTILILDVMVIAFGFVFRVIVGAAAIGVQTSHWIIFCTFFSALFLGFGKRKNEIDILAENGTSHRSVLTLYTKDFLNLLIGLTSALTIISYALYTIDTQTITHFNSNSLLLTIPFVIYGIFRYYHLMYNKIDGGDPTVIILTDIPTITTISLWLITFYIIIHSDINIAFF